MLQWVRDRAAGGCERGPASAGLSASIAIGAGLGAPLGMIAFDNVGVGIAFGVALGSSGIFALRRR